MSYCRQEGKDWIIFVTKEDHETPSSAELVADDPSDPNEEHGLMLPNGDVNWNCLGGMASGPCGEQFKSAFSCFHYSTEDIKGSDCIDHFRAMQECMQKYPDLYPQDEEEVTLRSLQPKSRGKLLKATWLPLTMGLSVQCLLVTSVKVLSLCAL